MNYNGGKNGAGVYQKIISMMPQHKVYIECFLGSGAILRNKKPAEMQFGIDLDDLLIINWMRSNYYAVENLKLFSQNVIDWLSGWYVSCNHWNFEPQEVLIYCDPPYLKSVRKSKHRLYKFEFWTEEDHRQLLEILLTLKSNVMISGYDSPLYNDLLNEWRKETFSTSNRAGQKTIETVWMNFQPPAQLHDYQYLGADFRERERIKRKKLRWKNRLEKMDYLERNALIETIRELNF
jgi:site-specific DNA-adenine methylase